MKTLNAPDDDDMCERLRGVLGAGREREEPYTRRLPPPIASLIDRGRKVVRRQQVTTTVFRFYACVDAHAAVDGHNCWVIRTASDPYVNSQICWYFFLHFQISKGILIILQLDLKKKTYQ